MSTHPESFDRPIATSSTDLANLGAQLSEVLNRFNELSTEMTAQRRVIHQLVAGSGSGGQSEPLPANQTEPQPILLPYTQTSLASHVTNPPEETCTYLTHGPYYYSIAEPFTLDTAAQGKVEAGESSAPIDKNLLKRLDRKYDGTGNPKTHLRMFANKLGKPIDDENLPIPLFPESLEGDYEYNCELALTRTTLEGTKRKPFEDHKTYAKRWRKLAAKVEPPMTEEEIVRTFIKTHDLPYFEEIFRMTRCSFAEIINKLEEYDEFVRAGKIVNVSALKSQLEPMQNQGSSSKKSQFKKGEEETSFVWNQGRPLDQVYKQLKAAGKIGTIPPKVYTKGVPPGYDLQSFCAYHSRAPGHSTVNCWVLKHKIQDMIEAGDIILRRREEQGPSVSKNPLPVHKDTVGVITMDEEIGEPTQYVVDEAEIMGVIGEPFILEEESYEIKENADPFILDVIPFECEPSKLIVLELPEQAPVLNLQEFSWNYSEPTLLIGGEETPKKEVAAITRSGRIVGETAVDEPSRAKEKAAPKRPAVIEEEAFNFLRMMKKSEEALLKVLNETQVPKNIPVDKFTHVVEHVLASNQISFSDEDLTAEGIEHNKALYISVRCNGKLLPRVLIDNGSALNICPWNTLVKLGFQEAKLRPSATVIRGFDGAKRESMGEVDLVLEIGLAQFQFICQVMDFSSAYNILLGRPWIHTSGAIPSSLY
ncbi:uncharacterized protein [Coffea arabica]|uniref:Retrotransposon gag domain-containing protein n=1 Tax=Coffea arabica TaxID=13443 RepID=A0ABM4UEF7_COFAR